MAAQGPLHGLRVVEITDLKGAYAGKLLADLGADVVLVEPPEGSATRNVGPFAKGHSAVDGGMFHQWMNTSKRSYVAESDSPDREAEVG